MTTRDESPRLAHVALYDALPTAVLVVSARNLVAWSNVRARALLGRDAVSEHLDDVFVGPHDDTTDRQRCKIIGTDGSTRTIGLMTNALPEGGSVVVFQDITEQVRLQDERDRLLQLAAVAEVLPSILHEVKNPLAAVTTAVEVLLDDDDQASREVIRTDLHRVLGELRRMRLVLEGVGLVGKDIYSSDSAIDFAMSEVVAVLRPRAARSGIELFADVQTMPLLPLNLGALRAVAFNLINNAIQACTRGNTITLVARLVDNVLRVAVLDDGPGMSADVAARCTELFFTTKPKGSGIGLALVARLARTAGGNITIDSGPGRGTRVEVHIPIPSVKR